MNRLPLVESYQAMTTEIRIKRGLNLPLAGEAPLELRRLSAKSTRYGVIPDDYCGVVPKLAVRVGDSVLAGDPLLFHKRFPELKITSPVSGTIAEIVRGAKRKILSIVITPSEEQEYHSFPVLDLGKASREEIRDTLLASGMWAFMRQRPYDIVAEPHVVPRDIFVTAHFTAPLAPGFDFLAERRIHELQPALKALTKLTDGKVYLSVAPDSKLSIDIPGVEMVKVHGPHPAGTVGLLLNKIRPLNKGEVVFTAKATDLLAMGRFLTTGHVDYTRRIALTGSEAGMPGYFDLLPGCHVEEVFASQLAKKNSHERVINGNVLVGRLVDGAAPFLSLAGDQLTVIPEGDNVHEAFGWIAPRFRQFSISHSYFSWLMPRRKYALDARLKGGERAMIMSNEFPKVFPLNIYAEALLKAIIAYDIDQMEALGIYEVAPEDFALCEFVDSSKQPLQQIVREGLDQLYKEMN